MWADCSLKTCNIKHLKRSRILSIWSRLAGSSFCRSLSLKASQYVLLTRTVRTSACQIILCCCRSVKCLYSILMCVGGSHSYGSTRLDWQEAQYFLLVCSFVRSSVTKLVNTVFWKLLNQFWCTLAQVWSTGQGIKWSTLGVRRSTVKVTLCRGR